ncbi:hypothetical protein NEOLEDRAFT_1140490 [Neolentinus lepideus HHB14362 ss-1]|uniref:Response regulatory domain-containing protein n=1 Tax=Neolentinus lepideus HHB14362 ss-1 TaxID=1314782 RepID=A0A165P824_9AGAM|nr:hypothetical protein NEOLEDRAFT_1140490 [Neolentinus lepideus HHB14362 ss-1]
MSAPRLPAVRLPTLGGDREGISQDAVVMELPPSSNKFGFAWPAEGTQLAPVPTPSDRTMSLSSSDPDSELSDAESLPQISASQAEPVESGHDITPKSRLNLDQNPIEQLVQSSLTPPRLSRAFSMPLPHQLSYLQNPRRVPSDSAAYERDGPEPESSRFHELSLELADSVQMVIQTLLQLSPPQVLDPAKEQFSACSLSIPTPSVSAMFTSMKNLNYMSANMSAFSSDPSSPRSSPPLGTRSTHDDFDVGEMLQSVGDALSGVAAQAGVDVVLFHHDVGMKHVAVKGDECGISYALTHIVRQVINTAARGDTIEIGLSVRMHVPNEAELPPSDATEGDVEEDTLPVVDLDAPIRCVFDVFHKFGRTPSTVVNGSSLDSRPVSSQSSRSRPQLESSLLLRRLLRHIGASLEVNLPTRNNKPGRTCQMTMCLERGDPSAVNPAVNLNNEEAGYFLMPEIRLANEPTLEDLLQFADTLRGKKVDLYASAKGSFAHHLTSYLTAWGLDVRHVSPAESSEGENEDPAEEVPATADSSPREDRHSPIISAQMSSSLEFKPQGSPDGLPSSSSGSSQGLTFIIIDDDVSILRERLKKLRAEQFQSQPHTIGGRKRPSLAAYHRPRSSPHVARSMGGFSNALPLPVPVVIVHFTSLSNFKLVKDAIHSLLAPPNGPFVRPPEIIVIPKPAGPRRFLTALHTAVTKPVVDPFFTPIATSPVSPGLNIAHPFFHNYDRSPRSPLSRPTRPGSDRSNRSPKEEPLGQTLNLPPPSPLGMSDGMEYFSEAAVEAGMKLGHSPSSGLVIQSPDGSPAGIFFHPGAAKPAKGTAQTLRMEREPAQLGATRRGCTSRQSSEELRLTQREVSPSPFITSTASAIRRPSVLSGLPGSFDSGNLASPRSDPGHISPHVITPLESPNGSSATQGLNPPFTAPKKPNQSDVSGRNGQAAPLSPRPAPTGSTHKRPMRRPTVNRKSPGAATAGKKPIDPSIVPPISVLIVDDNPINQTILSTFMRKKKIKYDVAKNGEEAVEKWRTGGFHLILMDIQMPVMDGIQATKEIRRMEKASGSQGFPTPSSEEARTPSESPSTISATTPYRSSVIIVALTASSLQSDRVAALAAGCNDFLTKPVSLQWLNNKIIEWGSIKALQMWADLRPEVVKSISSGQAAQAQSVAQKLHVPEGRSPSGSPSRSSSLRRRSSRAGESADNSKSSTPRPKPVARAVLQDHESSAQSSLHSGNASPPTQTRSTSAMTKEWSEAPSEVIPNDHNVPSPFTFSGKETSPITSGEVSEEVDETTPKPRSLKSSIDVPSIPENLPEAELEDITSAIGELPTEAEAEVPLVLPGHLTESLPGSPERLSKNAVEEVQLAAESPSAPERTP